MKRGYYLKVISVKKNDLEKKNEKRKHTGDII